MKRSAIRKQISISFAPEYPDSCHAADLQLSFGTFEKYRGLFKVCIDILK